MVQSPSPAHPTTRRRQQEQALLSGTTTPYPPAPIQIMTWYMSDTLSFAVLVHLLQNQPQYRRIIKLELVTPSSGVIPEDVEDLARFIRKSRYLQQVTIYTVKMAGSGRRSSLTNPREMRYLKQLEEACEDNNNGNDLECSIKLIPTGDPHMLCDSLTTTITEGRYRRHLALDGLLLDGISRGDLEQLAFDISWDRSIHVCLLKDVPPAVLNAIVPKLAHTPLQTLKIVNDPALGNSKRLRDAPIMDWTPLIQLLGNRRLKTLQRLYMGFVRIQPTSQTRQFLEALRKHKTIRQLELALCQFDSGTGRLLNALVNEAKLQTITLRAIQFYYPILSGTDAAPNVPQPPPPPPPPPSEIQRRDVSREYASSLESRLTSFSSSAMSSSSQSSQPQQLRPSALNNKNKCQI